MNVDTLGFDVDVQSVRASGIIPFHGVASEARYETIKKSLEDDGWDGTPIVFYDDVDKLALGGAHRIAAARELGMDIPAIEIGDLIRAAGEALTDYDIESRDDAIEALGVVPGISRFA